MTPTLSSTVYHPADDQFCGYYARSWQEAPPTIATNSDPDQDEGKPHVGYPEKNNRRPVQRRKTRMENRKELHLFSQVQYVLLIT
jgi:hypothetical protein